MDTHRTTRVETTSDDSLETEEGTEETGNKLGETVLSSNLSQKKVEPTTFTRAKRERKETSRGRGSSEVTRPEFPSPVT